MRYRTYFAPPIVPPCVINGENGMNYSASTPVRRACVLAGLIFAMLVIPLSALAQEDVEERAVVQPTGVITRPQQPQGNPYKLTNSQRDATLRRLSPEHRREISHIATDIANGRRMSSIQNSWAVLVGEIYTSNAAPDTASLVRLVMNMSCLSAQHDLKQIAEKVKNANYNKMRLRTQIEQARSQQWQESQVAVMQAALTAATADAQLANIDLQNQLQKQQQTRQTLSNVSNMLHDTARAVIRKIG